MLSSVQKSKHKTYAEVTRATNVSLLHTDITPIQQENADITRVHQTRIYRSSRSAGAFLFDITSCKPTYYDQQCMVELKKQHPNVHACMALSDGPTRYLEVYVTSANDSNDIQRNGLSFPDAHLQVLPCKAINERAEIIKLKLSHLPMFTPDEVLKGLKTSLAVFGNVLDIGISTEKATGLFMGSGYAVIDISLNPETPDLTYQQLSHQISWMESTTDVFRATWNNIPTWCRYCHKDGHSKFNCDASKARILCYSCHEQGHRSYECTRRNYTVVPYKKKDRKTPAKREPTTALPSTKDIFPSPTTDLHTELVDRTVDKENDIMSVYDDGSIIDEDEQMLRDESMINTMELEEFTPKEIDQAIQEVYKDQEIAPVFAEEDGTTITGWSLVKHTARAVELTSWLQGKQNAHLYSPTGIVNYRPSQSIEEGLYSEANHRSH